MNLNDALRKGQEKHSEAKLKQFEKRTKRPVTTSGLIQFFQDLYYQYDLGQPPLINNDTRNKTSGLIRLLRNNDFEDREIWSFIRQVFENWDYFKQQNFYTDNQKKYILAIHPDLKDIINCKGQFLQELAKKKDELECNSDEQNEDLLDIWNSL